MSTLRAGTGRASAAATVTRARGARSRSRASIAAERVGGEHVVAERDQLLGELAGAGAELEDAAALGPGEPRGGLPRVRRAPRS